MFRAIYKIERGRKKVCGWIINKNQTVDSPYDAIPGTSFSGVLRSEEQIPQGDVFVDAHSNLVVGEEFGTSLRVNDVADDIKENNIDRLKEHYRNYIFAQSPLENQLIGLNSLGSGFQECEKWIKDQLLHLREGINEIRNASSADEAFRIRSRHEQGLEERSCFPDVSVLDLVNWEKTSYPQVLVVEALDTDEVSIGIGRVIHVAHQTTAVASESFSFTNKMISFSEVEPSVTYEDGDRTLTDNGIYTSSMRTYSKTATLSLHFDVPTHIRDINMRSESEGNIYMVVDGGAQQLFMLNKSNPINMEISDIVLKVPQRLNSIGPLNIFKTDSDNGEAGVLRQLNLSGGSRISISKDGSVRFCILKEGQKYLPSDQGLVRSLSRMSLTDIQFENSTSVNIDIDEDVQLELEFTDSNTREISVTTTRDEDKISHKDLLEWNQTGDTLKLPEALSGELIVTKI